MLNATPNQLPKANESRSPSKKLSFSDTKPKEEEKEEDYSELEAKIQERLKMKLATGGFNLANLTKNRMPPIVGHVSETNSLFSSDKLDVNSKDDSEGDRPLRKL